MSALHARRSLAFALCAWIASTAAAAGQDTLARAKDLYVLAAYDEALIVLNRLHPAASPPESSEIAGYQVFCLLALGRTEDAEKAIAELVKADPLYRPSESTASPRTRAAFDGVRRGLLPAIVQETYDRAKAAFDRKEPQVAAAEFDRVLTLLDEPGLAELQNMADLRRLASGFRDLSKAAIPPASPAAANGGVTTAPVSPPPAPLAATPAREEPRVIIYGADDTGVVPPTSISRATPAWYPRNEIEKRRQFTGILELIVDESGNVVSAALGRSIHAIYDPQLLERARTWKFRPATKDGVPVRYRMTVEIRLGPGAPKEP